MGKLFCPTCKEEFEQQIRYCPHDGTAVISPKSDELENKIFDQRYKIMEKIGEGGMGAVYKAVQLSTGKFVAIKVVSANHTQNEETIKRFQREVKLQTQLSHPNLVSILDFSKTSEGEYYFVMEFVEGKSLSRRIKESGQMELEEFMEITFQLCDGLEYAHRQGIIHRDLKGDNIIVMDLDHQLVVKILDFGLAKAVMEEDQQITSEITQMGSALGTPAYMAPEQAMGEVNKLGPHTDIYTLGVMLFQMLAGQLPFKASTPWGLMQKHIAEAPPSVRDFNRSVPNAVSKIIIKCLEKEPDARYSSALAIKRDLEKTTFALQKDESLDLSDSGESTVNIRVERSRALFRFVLFLLVVAALGGAITSYNNNPQLYSNNLKAWKAAAVSYTLNLLGQAPPPVVKPPPGKEPVPPPDDTVAGDGEPVTTTDLGAPEETGPVAPPIVDEATIEEFVKLIAEANKALEADELTQARDLLAQAEILIPHEPNLEMAKKALTERVEDIAKSISNEIGYIDSIDKKWGYITISAFKGVKVDLEETLYTLGKDGKVKKMVVKKFINSTTFSSVTEEKLSQFGERMKVTRKPPIPVD
ncbi:MAG: serine/threonine protein kinase [Nitrospinota bacterium]|nr:serine/threonine protein kinase [Nitrospinota bacterium]